MPRNLASNRKYKHPTSEKKLVRQNSLKLRFVITKYFLGDKFTGTNKLIKSREDALFTNINALGELERHL